MKKILFLLTFVCVQTIVYAQLNVGINAIGQLPQSNFKQMSNFGYGGSISLGYTFAKRVDLSVVYSIFDYTGTVKGLNLDSKTAEIRFFFLTGNTRPYLGCGLGQYHKINKIQINNSPTIDQEESESGFEPKIGVLFDSRMLKRLFFDASISYLKTNLKINTPEGVNLSLGLKYMFDFKKK